MKFSHVAFDMTTKKTSFRASVPKSKVVKRKRSIKPLAMGRSASMDDLVKKVHASNAFLFESACVIVDRAVKASKAKALPAPWIDEQPVLNGSHSLRVRSEG